MEKVIWKYTLDFADDQSIRIPAGAKILSLQMQNNKPTVWAMVNPESPKVDVKFYMIGTGCPVSLSPCIRSDFAGTFQRGGFVYHVFFHVEPQN